MKIILITAVWCPSCLIMRPLYQKIAKENGFELTEIDYDEEPSVREEYKLGKILPAAVFILEGKFLFKLVGEKSRKDVIEAVNAHYYEKIIS